MFAILIFIILAQLALILWFFSQRKPSAPHTAQDTLDTLKKTQEQLYREISRHESTETRLRETQQYLQSIVNSMPCILVGLDVHGYITHWNLAARDSKGLHHDEAIGAHINHVYPGLPITPELIQETIQSANVFRRENIQQGVGSQATFMDITLYPLKTEGEGGAVLMVEDVTKQLRVESMLIQSDKMMSLGEMAAGMAHEINNPLAAIINNAQNIERRCSQSLPANQNAAEALGLDMEVFSQYLEQRGINKFLNIIRSAGEQAAQIVKNMLEFSRANYQTHTLHNAKQLIEESLELTRKNLELRTSLGIEMPKVTLEASDSLPPLPCSATEIKQVLINLIRNAAQAFQSDEYGPPLDPQVNIVVNADQTHMHIEIRDNGPGMLDEVKRHIFEPFFTTKDVGKGTGLGLSVCYFIITEHHQGTIEVESWPGEGSRFTIGLPLGNL